MAGKIWRAVSYNEKFYIVGMSRKMYSEYYTQVHNTVLLSVAGSLLYNDRVL